MARRDDSCSSAAIRRAVSAIGALAGHDHQVGPHERREPFAPRSGGQRPPHRLRRFRAHQADIQVARDVEALIGVIQHQHLGALRDRPHGTGAAIRIFDHDRARHQLPVHQRLVAADAPEQDRRTSRRARRSVRRPRRRSASCPNRPRSGCRSRRDGSGKLTAGDPAAPVRRGCAPPCRRARARWPAAVPRARRGHRGGGWSRASASPGGRRRGDAASGAELPFDAGQCRRALAPPASSPAMPGATENGSPYPSRISANGLGTTSRSHDRRRHADWRHGVQREDHRAGLLRRVHHAGLDVASWPAGSVRA